MLSPRFLADEDLRFEIMLATRRMVTAIEFASVHEPGRDGRSDAEQLDFAHSEGYIFVSHDVNTLRGLANARIVDGRGASGVLLTAQSNPTRDIAETIEIIWAASEAAEWIDRVVFIPF